MALKVKHQKTEHQVKNLVGELFFTGPRPAKCLWLQKDGDKGNCHVLNLYPVSDERKRKLDDME